MLYSVTFPHILVFAKQSKKAEYFNLSQTGVLYFCEINREISSSVLPVWVFDNGVRLREVENI